MPFKSDVTADSIPLIVSSISEDPVNPLGGDTLKFKGKGFPRENDKVTVTFEDSSDCRVETVNENELTCKVEKMKNRDGKDQKVVVKLKNGKEDQTQVCKQKDLVSVAGVDKTNVSPVEKQQLVFTLGNKYTDPVLKE